MGIIDTVFPTKCLECGREGVYVCADCLGKVANAKLFCVECKKRSIDGLTHERCKTKYSADFIYSPWSYEGVVRKALLKLKYNYAAQIAIELGTSFSDQIKKSGLFKEQKAYFTAVPLHWYRSNLRGFNQSLELGRYISCDFRWKLLPDLLVRRKTGKHQAGLKGGERVKNIKGVFEFNEKYKKLAKEEKPVIVFDDVLTTGSTISECAKVLKKNGVKKVWGLTVAA